MVVSWSHLWRCMKVHYISDLQLYYIVYIIYHKIEPILTIQTSNLLQSSGWPVDLIASIEQVLAALEHFIIVPCEENVGERSSRTGGSSDQCCAHWAVYWGIPRGALRIIALCQAAPLPFQSAPHSSTQGVSPWPRVSRLIWEWCWPTRKRKQFQFLYFKTPTVWQQCLERNRLGTSKLGFREAVRRPTNTSCCHELLPQLNCTTTIAFLLPWTVSFLMDVTWLGDIDII